MTGERFQGKSVPLELLRDLAVLEAMIIDIAKWRYVQENPDRQRVPRGFTDGVSLRMTGLAEGSAIAEIELYVESGDMLPPAEQIYFEQARTHFLEAINAANDDQQAITAHLPEYILGYFDRLGRGLAEGEAIEFDSDSRTRPALLTRESRHRLVLASSRVNELTDEVTLRGYVCEADQRKMKFHLEIINGPTVPAPISEQHFDTIIGAFNGYQDNQLVMLKGVGRYSRSHRLLSIDEVEHVAELDPNDIAARAEMLKTLKDGWHDGNNGCAPAPGFLDWLVEHFNHHYPDELPFPFVYPTTEGGVQIEWSFENQEITLEIDPDTHSGHWHSLSFPTGEEDEQKLDLQSAESWSWLVSEVERLKGDEAQ